jgi:hypothetical protein
MCVIITYPVTYFTNNWYVDLHDADEKRFIIRKIQTESLYYTPRFKLNNEDLEDFENKQEEINNELKLPKIEEQNIILNDAPLTKDWKNNRYFMKCFMTGKGIGVILNTCNILNNNLIKESKNVDGVKFHYYEKCKCPENKKNKIKEDINRLNKEVKELEEFSEIIQPPAVKKDIKQLTSVSDFPVVSIKSIYKNPPKSAAVAPKVPSAEPPKPVIVEEPVKKKIKIKKKIESKKSEQILTEEETLKLKQFDDLYKGKLLKKAKANSEYITLKFKSIPPKSHFVKDLPIKEGKKYLSTPERPMNATIKRYIDLIYPEQKYNDKMEEMIDKIRIFGLLMKNIEKERNKNKAEIIPVEEKKTIKQEILIKKKALFTDLYNYYKKYVKDKKEGKKETREDKKIKKNKIDELREYIRNLRDERNLTANVFAKKEYKKQIDDIQDIINELVNKKTKRMKELENEEFEEFED